EPDLSGCGCQTRNAADTWPKHSCDHYAAAFLKNKKTSLLTVRLSRPTTLIVSTITPVSDAIRAKLTRPFAPVALTLIAESAKHAGHSGARPEGETHFRVRIVSAAFAGVNRVERQRKVYAVLSEELMNRVHALSLSALTPEEV